MPLDDDELAEGSLLSAVEHEHVVANPAVGGADVRRFAEYGRTSGS
ncbi:hypothetical protein [Pseudonocardia kunmingensis]|nr:hypothetical protein [Pseudonocardia kunmingensis]